MWLAFTFVVKSCQGSLHCPEGKVIVEPASTILSGTNVSITCTSTNQDCHPQSKIYIYLGDYHIDSNRINRTTAYVHLPNVSNFYYINCYINCKDPMQLWRICWNSVTAGYPPDKPTNLKCSSNENSDDMTCTWDKGRDTHIPNNYSVSIKNLQTSDERTFVGNEFVTIPVNKLQDKDFAVLVKASNFLGQSESDLLQVVLDDIVVPIKPVITRIEILNSMFKISTQWRNQTSANLCYCAVEWKTIRSETWTWVKEDVISKPIVLFTKEHIEALELRVQCREETGKSYWSEWSDPKKIPDTAPAEIFDVWRVLGTVFTNGSREVTILIKLVAPEAPRGRIVGFKVFYENEDKETVNHLCDQYQKGCRVVAPMGIRTIFIAAYNLHGISTARNVTMQNTSDFPRLQNVYITKENQTSVLITWEIIKNSEAHLCWFILHWVLDSCDGKYPNVSWRKIPKDQTHSYIEDIIILGRSVNISLYAVSDGGSDLIYSYFGFLHESEPERGPSSEIKINDGNKILIEWTEVPLCEQKGLLINYTVHLKNGRNDFFAKFYTTMRFIEFNNLDQDAFYTVCVSVTTAAGESPCGNSLMFKPDQGFHSYIEIFLAISFGAVMLIVFVLTLYSNKAVRVRIKTFILSWLPNCLKETYPRVENSIVLKSFQDCREVTALSLTSLCADPEILEIQEPLLQENTKVPEKHKNIPECQSSLSLNDNLPEEALPYRPQITNPTCPRRDSYLSPAHMMDIQRTVLHPDNIMPNICTNTNSLFLESGIDMNSVGLQGLDSLLTTDFDQDNTSGPFQYPHGISLDFIRQSSLFSGLNEGQNFPFDQHRYEDFSKTKTCFPQI